MKSKIHSNYLLFSCLSLFIFIVGTGCKLDDTSPNPQVVHGYVSLDALYLDGGHMQQTFVRNAGQEAVFTTENGTNVSVDAGSLKDQNGNAVTGDVEMRVIEVNSKSDRLLSNRPLQTDGGTLLESAGSFSITAFVDQQQLTIDDGLSLLFAADAQTSALSDLDVYYHVGNGTGWEPATDNSTLSLEDITGGQAFDLSSTRLGWMSASQPLQSTNGTTSVSVSINKDPADMLELKVYLIFDDFQGMAELPLLGNTFSASGIPLNENASLVAIGLDKFRFYFDHEPITITSDFSTELNLRNYEKETFFSLIRSID